MTPHIEAKKEEIADTVIMPGDPLRAKMIAENFLEDYKLVNKVRNIFAYTGSYKGKKVTVFASGMGIPSIGIYAFELFKFYDVKRIIRVGTCGSFDKNIKVLDVILSEKAQSKTFFPKLLDNVEVGELSSTKSLNEKLIASAKENNIQLKVGRTITSDIFDVYCDDIEAFRSNFDTNGVIGVEMEAYALFYLAKRFNKEASCLMTVVDSLFDKRSLTSEERENSVKDMIKIALDAIK